MKVPLRIHENIKMCVYIDKKDPKVVKNTSGIPNLSSRTPAEILDLLIDV